MCLKQWKISIRKASLLWSWLFFNIFHIFGFVEKSDRKKNVNCKSFERPIMAALISLSIKFYSFFSRSHQSIVKPKEIRSIVLFNQIIHLLNVL